MDNKAGAWSWTWSQRIVVALLIGLMLLAANWLPFMDRSAHPMLGVVWANMTAYLPALAVALVAQLAFPAVRRRAKILTYEMWVDVMHVLFNFVFFLTFLGVGVLTIKSWMIESSPVFMAWAGDWHFLLQTLLGLWMFDFLVYWRHRLSHEVKVIWPVHAVHHISRRVDVLTTHRLHFLEVMVGGIVASWAVACSGLEPEPLALAFMIYLEYNHFIHANVRVRYAGWLKYVLVSPFMHRWHHALEPEAHGRNYAVVFSFHDWLFGTALHPAHEPEGYGVDFPEHEQVGESWLRQQIYPFRVWMQRGLTRLSGREHQ